MNSISLNAAAPRVLGLSIVLIALAALEIFDGLSGISVLFSDSSEIPTGLGGLLIKTHIATHPLLGVVALTFAAMGRVRYAIMALGILVMMAWLSNMPSVVLRGLDFTGLFSTLESVARIIVFPLIGACAIAYAARNEHLGRATCLVAIPTLFGVLSVIAFIIGIRIYGF